MASPQFNIAQTVVFTDPRQRTSVKVPAGHVIVAMSRGTPPRIIDVGEGNWEIDCPVSLADPKSTVWPVLMMVVPTLHAKSFVNTAGIVERIFSQLPAAGVPVTP